MRRASLLLLVLAACRQALGIPGSGSLEGEASGFAVIAEASGASAASGGATVTINDTTQPLTDGTNRLVAGLQDGDTYLVTTSNNCRVANGSGAIDGEDAHGVTITCDGLAALQTFGFTAPVTFAPSFDPAVGDRAAQASFLVQETYFKPAGVSGSTITAVEASTSPAQMSGDRYGPYAFAAVSSFGVKLSSAGFTRTYSSAAAMQAPALFAYGKPNAVTEDGWFGAAIATSGDLMVVGAPNAGKGRAFVYRRTSERWVEEQELVSPAVQAGDRFGEAVAIFGTKIVVGAPGSPSRAGAAYVFTGSGSTWTAGAALVPTDSATGDDFGAALALSSQWIVVGAPGAGGTGCIYEANGAGGLQKVTFANVDIGDRVGAAVAISGTTIVVGAPGDDSGSTSRTDNAFRDAGAAYLIDAGQTSGERFLKSMAPGADDRFGTAVAIEDTFVLIGAPLEDSGAIGFDGDQSDNTAIGAGAVYMFSTDGSAGPYIKAPNTGAGDNFGRSVAIRAAIVNGTRTMVLAIGAPFEDSATSTQTDNSSRDAGAIYAYPVTFPSGSTGAPQIRAIDVAYLKTTHAEAGDNLGAAIALTTDSLVAGAPLEDSATTGWNTAPDESSLDSGAVFTFR